ncbi:MAG: NAD(P)/FAD-dependent oxidoreductase [Gemmatimonadetes bacterium]|nr:NAD(P)/FAD-dependent oxidoreductase [Gemmatimonadota bacterium]
MSEHVDVLIVGAGLSGIGAAVHLTMQCPNRTFAILEGRPTLGGTWDLFRYPGIRSDSDMFTLGYRFRPWTDAKAIADGPSILRYLRETAAEYGIDRKIRFNRQVRSASWSSADARWTVTVERRDTGDTETVTCGYLLMAVGYYSYRGGHLPSFPGQERFLGQVVHPQEWPVDLDHTGKRIVVIGSGATAVTLVPALAKTAAHVTMLQRSPSYLWAIPDRDRVADLARALLPGPVAYRLIRWKNIGLQLLLYRRSRKSPERMTKWFIGQVRDALGADYDVERHFTPRYAPWDQRLCIVPNGDLFEAIRSGRASVVTDTIRTWDEGGIELESGQRLDADLIVTATGLELVVGGEIRFEVDGRPVDFAKTWTYRGAAYSGVPNLVSIFGYINASWTLRADLISEYVCRLLNRMERTGATICVPELRDGDRTMAPRPFIENFSSGYLQRIIDRLPRQGDWDPWLNPQDYRKEQRLFSAPVDDGVMQFRVAVGSGAKSVTAPGGRK